MVQWGAVAGGEATATAHNVAALVAAGDYAALVELLRCGNAARKAAAAGELQDLAYNNDANKAKIVKAGAVAPLVELLRCGDVAGKTAAAWTLNNLASISANQLGEDREGWSGGASGGAA